jgi:hypothetical protein
VKVVTRWSFIDLASVAGLIAEAKLPPERVGTQEAFAVDRGGRSELRRQAFALVPVARAPL